VASVALVAPAGFGDSISSEFIDGFTLAASRRDLKAVLPMLFADPSLINRELTEEILRYKREPGVAEALGAVRDQLFRDGTQAVQISASLAGLAAPMLVIWGSEDRVLPVEQSGAAPSAATVEVLEGIGHSPHVEAAAQVNGMLAEFIAAAAGGAEDGQA
jgi:pyruvate dehydrogenase E2 component (dihydrolipoamide acetyltransferase)